MRLMSFAATVEQMRSQQKTVTRRIDRKGWWAEVLTPGTLVCACEKTQGIPKGGSVTRIGVIEIVDVRREPLQEITNACEKCPTCGGDGFVHDFETSGALVGSYHDPRIDCPDCYHGFINSEVGREGFHPSHPGEWFVDLFCDLNGCEPAATITRIAFKHRPDLTTCCGAPRRVWSGGEGTNHYECSECGGLA